MSLYQQPRSAYGHPYPPQAYVQPQMPGYAYHPPAPQPMYYADPGSFRRDYAARLSELTMNSRPIIQALSIMAQEFNRYADIVAQCLEVHIRRVAPWMKLPAFYLLDSISKNVYEFYAPRFSTFVVSLFLETYGQVDQPTKSKMEEMLITWRTGAPNGKELFGVAPQIALERNIWGNDSSSTSASSTRGFSQGSAPPTKSQVLAELEVTLAHKERQVQLNPYDTTSQNHINVLHQLRRLIEAGVSQEELNQILMQLRVLAKEVASVPPPKPSIQHHPMASQSSTYGRTAPPPVTQPHPQVSYPSQPSTSSYPPVSQLTQLLAQTAQSASTSTTSVPSGPTLPDASNLANLFDSLRKAGVIMASSTSAVAVAAGPSIAVEEQKQPIPVDLNVKASREYAKSVRAMKIKLNSSDITKQRPQFVPFLYERQSLQCKQCGIRFFDNPAGKRKMEDHLDMHFRQNRRAQQNIGRGHSRSWFVGLDSWTHDVEDGKAGSGAGGSRLNAKAAAAAELAERESALRASFVVVPPGDEAKRISCPVCKEIMKSEFNEDNEEWVWRNAVRVKDKIYHATCHAELASSSNLTARLRSEVNHTSRSGTPEVISESAGVPSRTIAPGSLHVQSTKIRSSKSPTSTIETVLLAGTKRKADDDGMLLALQASERTPPIKKVAVA